jgi:ketosteroid isomerase-like protein
MRTVGLVLTVLALSAAPVPAQQFGPAPDAATQRQLLALREAAWRTWFSNDQEGFRRIVPDELVGLSWSGGPWEDRAQTMAQMQEFAKNGMTLKSLEFPRNVFQHYGDVVILYSTFRLALTSPAGQLDETAGRATEIFVRRNGRWIHTGWHLDAVAN